MTLDIDSAYVVYEKQIVTGEWEYMLAILNDGDWDFVVRTTDNPKTLDQHKNWITNNADSIEKKMDKQEKYVDIKVKRKYLKQVRDFIDTLGDN